MEYGTADESVQRSAEYERRYGKCEGIPQPRREGSRLHIEIYPDRGAGTIRGTYLRRTVRRRKAVGDERQ